MLGVDGAKVAPDAGVTGHDQLQLCRHVNHVVRQVVLERLGTRLIRRKLLPVEQLLQRFGGSRVIRRWAVVRHDLDADRAFGNPLLQLRAHQFQAVVEALDLRQMEASRPFIERLAGPDARQGHARHDGHERPLDGCAPALRHRRADLAPVAQDAPVDSRRVGCGDAVGKLAVGPVVDVVDAVDHRRRQQRRAGVGAVSNPLPVRAERLPTLLERNVVVEQARIDGRGLVPGVHAL